MLRPTPALRAKSGLLRGRRLKPPPADGVLATLYAAWLAAGTSSDRVHYVGHLESAWANDAGVAGALTTGRTFIAFRVSERSMQDGYLRRIRIQFTLSGTGSNFKVKVFRLSSGTTYAQQAESAAIAAITGTNSYNLATPLAIQTGDLIGIYLANPDDVNYCSLRVTSTAANAAYFAAGDLSSIDTSTATALAFSLNMDGLGTPPFLCVTGDSIVEGHNLSTDDSLRFHSVYDGGPYPAANRAAEPQYALLAALGSGYEYQNHAYGGQKFSWVNSTGIVSALTRKPAVVLIHCGVNDVLTDTWATVESGLDGIRTKCNAASPVPELLIDEILPDTNFDDTQAEIIDTFNENLATWCAANNATLIRCHDAMGQIRGSTGQGHDLLEAYSLDGVHLTAAGVAKLVDLWRAAT